ncbi:MAG: hypothetical protein H0V72_17605 [Bradyrhizobium sp.]|nr:hypothetical protein [Bradyrhizobium sp.]
MSAAASPVKLQTETSKVDTTKEEAAASADKEVPGGIVHAEIFVTRDVPVDRLFVTEGSLKIVSVDELGEIAGELTPSALFGLRALTLI